MYALTIVKLEVNLTCQYDHVVHCFGAVRESGMAGGKLGDPEGRALTGADMIVVLHQASPLAASAAAELSTGIWFVDQISQPEILAPTPAELR